MVRYWLPVLAWLGLIFIGSTDLMSAEHTSRFIGPFLRWVRPDVSAETIAWVQFLVRKGAHLSEYAILALLLRRALHARPFGGNFVSSALTLLLASACAALDEFHQSFVASRTAALGDVVIDICGAALALALFFLIARNS